MSNGCVLRVEILWFCSLSYRVICTELLVTIRLIFSNLVFSIELCVSDALKWKLVQCAELPQAGTSPLAAWLGCLIFIHVFLLFLGSPLIISCSTIAMEPNCCTRFIYLLKLVLNQNVTATRLTSNVNLLGCKSFVAFL